jgi:ribosomal protein S18 acetylase RimI-like enzyme
MAEAAGATLARAFQDDPIQRAMFPDADRRAAVLPVVFTAMVRAASDSGGHLTTTPDTAAAAVWSPPGTEITPMAVMRAYGLDLPRVLFAAPLSSTLATFSFFGTLTRRRKVHAPEPHWYLATLGVDPARQGEGLGHRLVREGLDRADADRARAYLETETEGNVRFYRALGFEVVEQIVIERVDLPMWLMARDPA